MRSKGRTANGSSGDASGELDIQIKKRRKRTNPDTFDNTDALDETLKGNLNRGLEIANAQLDFAEARLEQARKSKNPKLIQDAAKALDSAVANHTAINTRLVDKFQALNEVRAKQEKAKPCTFYFNAYPPSPTIVPTREVPAELLPKDDNDA